MVNRIVCLYVCVTSTVLHICVCVCVCVANLELGGGGWRMLQYVFFLSVSLK